MSRDLHPARVAAAPAAPDTEPSDTVETRLWLEEHEWLYGLLHSEDNVAPKFRFPDLIGACVSLVFTDDDAAPRIFQFLRTELVLRPPTTPRRRESMWRAQYELLQALQRSPANRHPHPNFQLDQLTTACVALARRQVDTDVRVLHQARLNVADRSSRWRLPRPG
ncbi:hypothetical protein [Azohydromonas aeria]|uniref:hypothetical protein n=1 Tax=Azohydromonas aeria TaxID=2590212 RepID=UPI0012F7C58A|nr:hypothetical protein [Azohydromonas aeria]